MNSGTFTTYNRLKQLISDWVLMKCKLKLGTLVPDEKNAMEGDAFPIGGKTRAKARITKDVLKEMANQAASSHRGGGRAKAKAKASQCRSQVLVINVVVKDTVLLIAGFARSTRLLRMNLRHHDAKLPILTENRLTKTTLNM